MNLFPRKGLFSEGVEVKSVGRGGEVRRHVVDSSHFFTGQVEGNDHVMSREVQMQGRS